LLRSPEYDDARLAALLDQAKRRSRTIRRRRHLVAGALALALVAFNLGGGS
jgi:hypothetical protein